MFDNIGGKIKILATVITVVGIIASFVSGLILIADGNDSLLITGFFVLFGGSLFSWIGSFVLYGIGQLIENTDAIREHLTGSANTPAVKAPVVPYFCTNCGHPGPFSGNCPKCGSEYIYEYDKSKSKGLK